MPAPTRRALALATAIGLLAATPASAHPGHATKSVNLTFEAMAGETPVSCGTPIPGLGTTGQSAQLQDLRFYVTDVALTRKDGKAVPVELRPAGFQLTGPSGGVTLIDLENGTGACAADGTPAMNASVRGTVPEGSYTGASFTIGVPKALNHSDVVAAPSPLNLVAMGWSWQVGRKFLKVETADPTFLVHLGSTGCTGNPARAKTVTCTSSNRVPVKLTSFDPSRQHVAVDVKALLSGSTLTAAATGMGGMSDMAAGDQGGMDMEMSGCMSGPSETACSPIFNALGIAWKDGSGGGAASAARQTVFRAIAR